MSDPAADPLQPRPASTLVLLRDVDGALEVLLLKRHSLSDVHGGAHVFPGGKLDPADSRLDSESRLDESTASLHARLGEPALDPSLAAGLFVAALREAFEESGILLAHGATPALCREAAAHARTLAGATDGAFNALLAEFGLRLRVVDLVPYSRWVTPAMGQNKRFDTRFFVASAPAGALACHDNHETTEAIWMRPRAALQRNWDHEIVFAPPQIMTLAQLGRHASVQSVLAEARSRPPPVIAPVPIGQGAGRVMCYPGDPAHPVRERAMPGPLRLLGRNGRFEPEQGFEAFFA